MAGVGSTVRRFWVRPLFAKTVVGRGGPRAVVTLRTGSAQLARIQVPQRCQAPGVLPETGLRGSR